MELRTEKFKEYWGVLLIHTFRGFIHLYNYVIFIFHTLNLKEVVEAVQTFFSFLDALLNEFF